MKKAALTGYSAFRSSHPLILSPSALLYASRRFAQGYPDISALQDVSGISYFHCLCVEKYEEVYYYLYVKILSARYLKSVISPDRSLQRKMPEISFVGRSNVGKSSMINSLTIRKVAKTSSTPGATRLVNLYLIEYEHGGVRQQVIFSDFPGFGYSKVSKAIQQGWQKMIEGYIEGNKEIKRIIWVYDVRREPDHLDEMLLEWFLDRRLPFSVVLTKTDKESRGYAANKKKLFKQYVKEEEVLTFSAKTGEGRKELLAHIFDAG